MDRFLHACTPARHACTLTLLGKAPAGTLPNTRHALTLYACALISFLFVGGISAFLALCSLLCTLRSLLLDLYSELRTLKSPNAKRPTFRPTRTLSARLRPGSLVTSDYAGQHSCIWLCSRCNHSVMNAALALDHQPAKSALQAVLRPIHEKASWRRKLTYGSTHLSDLQKRLSGALNGISRLSLPFHPSAIHNYQLCINAINFEALATLALAEQWCKRAHTNRKQPNRLPSLVLALTKNLLARLLDGVHCKPVTIQSRRPASKPGVFKYMFKRSCYPLNCLPAYAQAALQLVHFVTEKVRYHMAKHQRFQARVVACGLDTVVANILPLDKLGNVVRCELPIELQEELDAYKLQAQQEEEKVATRWPFMMTNLLMLDKAGAPFKWILEHPKIKVSISRGVRAALWGEVRFSSEYLWEHQHCYDKAFSNVWKFLNTIFGENITLQASGVDLAKDFVGWDVGALSLDVLRERFITRAVSDDALPGGFNEDGMLDGPDSIKRRWKRITGLPFGKRNAAVSAILYDKTHEIRYQSSEKAWMYDVWQLERDENGRPVVPVWRLEGRLKRKALHEGSIESLWDLLAHLPDIWSYLVGHVGGGTDGLPDGWLRYVTPTDDTNRARWPASPEWATLQASFVPLGSAPAGSLGEFIRQRKREVNMDRAVACMAGYASTYEVFRRDLYDQIGKPFEAEPDISDTFHSLFTEVQSYLEEKSSKKKDADFSSVVAKKSVLYHVAAARRNDESEVDHDA